MIQLELHIFFFPAVEVLFEAVPMKTLEVECLSLFNPEIEIGGHPRPLTGSAPRPLTTCAPLPLPPITFLLSLNNIITSVMKLNSND